MTPDITKLVKRLRNTPLYEGSGEETDLTDQAASVIESLHAAYESACKRADEVEARNDFFYALLGLGNADFEQVRQLVAPLLNKEQKG